LRLLITVTGVISIERVVTVDKPVETVFAYLSDFETTVEWNPGAVSSVKTSGDGGVGTKYRNKWSFAGREAELEYVVQEFEPQRTLRLRGEGKTLNALGILTFRATEAGTEVTYRADFEFKGVARLVEPLFRGQFKEFSDEAEEGLRTALQKL
jgi:carbon monoxide dehydrogenase subunit G